MNNDKPWISSFLLSRPTSCSCFFLALFTQCFEHFLHALRRQRLPIPTHKHPNKTSSATNHSTLPFNDSQQTSPKTFHLSHQQKWCFQERFPPHFLGKKDGSDQIKLFQHRGGSRQEVNVNAYWENTHTTSIWQQGPIIWQLDISSLFFNLLFIVLVILSLDDRWGGYY